MLQETPPRSVFAGVPGERGLAHAARPFLFVSDLHLSDAIPHTVAAFERFVRVTADSADSVFILGDLFEYWIGDDILEHDPFAARMAALLHTFSERGIALYVMHGNRDFLLGKRFMKAAGALLIPDPSVIVAFGNRIVLAHGDAQCTADRGYQWFRRFARNGVAPPCRGIEPLQPHGRLIPSAKTYILCTCLIDGPLRRRIERFSPHPPS